MHIFVALPCYDGRVTVETARALLDEQSVASVAGDQLSIAFRSGSSLITNARDQLARDFLASPCERMVFVDSDVSWEPGALVTVARHPVDFCGGAYRKKMEPETYPVSWLDAPELWADPETGLLEVAGLPGGFLSLSRSVFERLREAFPQREYLHPDHSDPFHAFFHVPPGGGEDAAFCNDWRSIGGQVWLDPNLSLTHSGGCNHYAGCIGDWLRNR